MPEHIEQQRDHGIRPLHGREMGGPGEPYQLGALDLLGEHLGHRLEMIKVEIRR